MPRIILHQYASSPYSEKVRLALGLKGAAWGSVEIAALPPRPLLDPLTGGYRRVPVMQVGADVYCDTGAILPALERLLPGPSLYPDGGAGLSRALTFGFERDVWIAAIGVRAHFNADADADFLRDRREDYLYIDMSRAAMAPDYPRNLQRVAAHVGHLTEALADGRAFLGGVEPGAIDLGYVHVLWLIRNGACAEEIDAALGLAPILPWYERVLALGHGRPEPVDAEAALEAARAAEPVPVVASGTLAGLAPGDAVTVTPDDFGRRPVPGTLVAATAETVTIARRDARAGRLHLHFPRAGFVVAAA